MKYYQGDIYWAKMISDTNNEIAHPNVIIQNEILANSRLDNVIVCGISTNMKRANEIGNVRLKKRRWELRKREYCCSRSNINNKKERFRRIYRKTK